MLKSRRERYRLEGGSFFFFFLVGREADVGRLSLVKENGGLVWYGNGRGAARGAIPTVSAGGVA